MSFVTSARGLAMLAVLLAVVGAMLYLRFRGRRTELRQLLLGNRGVTAKSGAVLFGLSVLVIVLALLARLVAPVGALFPVIGALLPYALAGLLVGLILLWRARS
ncbi:MAG: hypothetical protein V4633_13635 [Pseudomonadota bacterium]